MLSRALGLGSLFTAAAIVVLSYAAPAGARGQAAPAPKGSAASGAKLFAGSVRLANGGPPCAGCHAVASIPFPNGGTMGPGLTGTFAKFGTAALGPVLASLPFPTMAPIFHDRPLTGGEQADLAAFFEAAANAPQPADVTGTVVAISCAGCAALLVLAGVLWRRRLPGVRRALVREMRGGRGGPRP